MPRVASDYWIDAVGEAFDVAKLDATTEQIATVARWMESAHECHSSAHGGECIPDPMRLENERLSRALKIEQSKVVCRECNGKGRIVTPGPYHYGNSPCHKCNGEGYVIG